MANYTLPLGYFNALCRRVSVCLLATLLILATGCDSEDNFVFNPNGLHSPLDIAVIPNTNVALVISTNFNFSNSSSSPQDAGGSIQAIDLTTNTLDANSAVQLPNFGGQISIDTTRLYVADRDNDEVRIYTYNVPGSNGKLIDITLIRTLEVGDDPFATLLITPTGGAFRKLFVGNLLTSDLSLINADALTIIDLDENDSDSEALPLNEIAVGSQNFSSQTVRPNRIVPLTGDLFLLSTTFSGLLFVMDAKNDGFEAIFDLRSISDFPQLNGIAVTPTGLAYVASHGAQGIIVLDLSGVTDNGIDNEVLTTPLVDIIPTGSEIEAMLLSQDTTKVYAANFSRNSVLVLNSANGFVLSEVTVGIGPTELALNDDGSRLFVTNFGSDSVSVIDTATDQLIQTIE